MSFTVKIDDTSPKAQSIINMLKELAEDYSFLNIVEDVDEINDTILREVDARKEYMENHPDEWKSWEEVKRNIQNS